MIGPETRATLSTNQMRNQNKSQLGRPRFRQFGCFFSEFSLALKGLRCCDYFEHSIEKHSICGTDDSEKQIGLFKNKWAPTKMSECHVFFPYTTP